MKPVRRLALAAACVTLLAGPDGTDAARRSSELSFGPGGHATIPFDLRNQHLWVRGRLNGADSVWIVIDTGASSSVLDEGVARRLSMKLTGENVSRGAGGTQVGHQAHDVTVELPGLTLRRERMGTLELGSITQTGGRPMQLILGYELFQSSIVRFDYERGVLDVWDPEHAPPPAGASVPMTLIENHPYVDATLHVPGRSPLTGRFVIDSGSSGALIVTPEITARESLMSAFPRTLVAMGRGVGGEVKNHMGRADSFSIGGLTFAKPLVAMPDPSRGRISVEGSIGNIGGQILGRCRVTFDYAQKRIHLEPSPIFDRPFEGDMSGATFNRTPEGILVRWVNPDSPAAEAGLQVGDRVTQVDDQPAEAIDPSALRLQLQKEGRTVRVKVQRGADTMEKTLTLRRLL
jgi:predicted aspartyl protease